MAGIIAACHSGDVPARASLVVSPRDGTPAVERARALGASVLVLSSKEEEYGPRLLAALQRAEVTLICLAGYMTLLPAEVVAAYPRRILNIHPALLPKYGGKGMYGHHVHEAVLAAGERESGCTVHFVNERYDEGDIVLQKRCRVEPGDTVETLSARVLDLEHTAYPEAIRLVLERDV